MLSLRPKPSTSWLPFCSGLNSEEMVSEGKITQNNCKKRKCEVTQMKENGHISAASEWGEREANVGHLPVLCLSSRFSPVGGHLPAPTCVTVTTSSHCSGLVARFNLKIVFDSRADFRFCSKWNPFILGIFDLRDVRFSGFYCTRSKWSLISLHQQYLRKLFHQIPMTHARTNDRWRQNGAHFASNGTALQRLTRFSWLKVFQVAKWKRSIENF